MALAVPEAIEAGHLHRSLAESATRTPLVELRRMAAGLPGRVAVKLESRNPSGSVKDRVALALVQEAEELGTLRPGGTIVAPTSSNTGIALAHLGAQRGYKVRLTIPEAWSLERIPLLLYLGADVVATPGSDMAPAVRAARVLAATTRGAVLLDQFGSTANADVHRRETAREIWADAAGQLGAFVAGVGTGGTITGVATGLRERGSRARIVAVEPASSAVLSGLPAGPHRIQGIGAGFVPPLFRRDFIDEIATVTDEEAFEHAHRLARDEGILAGVSSGAAVAAALRVAARKEMAGQLVVTMVCDSGERYVSTPRTPVAGRRHART
jgi:cysteine synthase A